MGLISFVKNVGASIFGGSEAKAAPAEELKKELDKHGLNSSNVKIEVEGDKVKVSGTAASTEQAEKIAIALGNTVGVQTVQNDIKPAKAEPEVEVLYGEERRHAVAYRRDAVRQRERRCLSRETAMRKAMKASLAALICLVVLRAAVRSRDKPVRGGP